jgi:Trk K+ transport system NAD-binding subunit
MAIKNVGVIGCGLMGSGIVQVSAQAGFRTVVVEASPELLERGLGGLRRTLDGLIAKAKLDEAGKKQILDRITGATDFSAFKDCDLVIEAITENQPLKNETFRQARRDLPPARPPRLQHLVVQRHRDGGGDQAPGAGAGAALLQPGAADEAGRGGADHPHRRQGGGAGL